LAASWNRSGSVAIDALSVIRTPALSCTRAVCARTPAGRSATSMKAADAGTRVMESPQMAGVCFKDGRSGTLSIRLFDPTGRAGSPVNRPALLHRHNRIDRQVHRTLVVQAIGQDLVATEA